jgi:ribosomal protein L7Ae-like RNA K-turn-binding protein
MAEKEAAGVLGLAQKAGRIASGDAAVRTALEKREAVLLLVATDTAANKEKELIHLAERANIPVIRAFTRAELGACLGKAPRAAAAVTDDGLAALLKKKLSIN